MTATSNASLINARLNNGVVVSNNGTDGNVFYAPIASYNGDNTAVFVADEWRISDRIKVDAGMRHERQRLSGSISNLAGADTDNNPLTVYNNGTSQPTGSYTGLSRERFGELVHGRRPVQAGRDASVFVRANQGHTFISFDDLRNAGSQDVVNDRNRVPNPKVTQYEVGFKTATPLYTAYVNAFLTDFTGISFQQITTNQRAVLGQRLEGQGRRIRTGGASDRRPATAADRRLAGLDLQGQPDHQRQRGAAPAEAAVPLLAELPDPDGRQRA